MDSCTLCPKGVKCRGYILHTLILKLYNAMEARASTASIVHELTHEDMLVLADLGVEAHGTCWTKAFVMAVGRKLADMAAIERDNVKLRRNVEYMIVQMDSLFAKLPKGVSVNIMDLSMEVFNQACEDLRELGSDGVLPANILGQAYASVARKKAAG